MLHVGLQSVPRALLLHTVIACTVMVIGQHNKLCNVHKELLNIIYYVVTRPILEKYWPSN